jgi:hypothetical protein
MIKPEDFTRGYEPQPRKKELPTASGTNDPVKTRGDRGRYTITRQQHPGGRIINYTIEYHDTGRKIKFQAHWDTLAPITARLKSGKSGYAKKR